MTVPISATFVYALSSIYKSETLNFINSNRRVSSVETTDYSTSLDLSYPEFSKYIISLNYKDNYFTFLTSVSRLSSYVNSLQGFTGEYYGSRMQDFTIKYNWLMNNFTYSTSAFDDTQILGIVDLNGNFNLLPLKTKISINDSQYSTVFNYKTYEKIYDYNDSLFLQFKIDKIPVEIIPDKYNLIFNSYNVSAKNINDTDFVKNGAYGGNCPLNSDIILFDSSEYGKYSNNGLVNKNAVNNGTLLCLWLSAQNPLPDSPKIWMERWYDPNTVSQGNALINRKLSSNNFTDIADLSSSKIFSEKEKMVYQKYGPDRNQTFLNSLSSNLKIHFSSWEKTFSSDIGNINGYIVGNYYSADNSTLKLDGKTHAHIPPEDDLFVENDLTVSLWAYCRDWKNNFDSQLFGNFNTESGYGIFYNTGTPNNLITIPTRTNNLFALNYKGYKVFEKDIKNDLGLSSLNIEYIKTDMFGNRWLYDSENRNIYKLENDDLIISSINLPTNSDITKMECNSHNELYIFDNYHKTLSSFSANGEFLQSVSTNQSVNNFEIDSEDTVILDSAEIMSVNSKNQIVKIVGSSLVINDEKVLFLTDKPTTLKIDSSDNIWMLLENSVIKTDPDGNILFTKQLSLNFSDFDAEMGFIKSYKSSSEELNLWIIFNKGKYALVLDSNGRITKRIDLVPLFIGNQCSDFELNIHGDFCGFDSRRKYELVNGKTISQGNPAISVKLGVSNGISKKIIQLHSSTDYLNDWANLSFSLKNIKDSTIINFYVNGILKDSKTLDDNYFIDYNYKSTPFIIGGISGKLGAKNLEKSVLDSGFFIGEISDIRIYNRVLDNYEIKSLSLNKHYKYWTPITFYIDCPPITMFEEIDSFHINRYKGFKSNYFNIKISNFTTDENIQQLMESYIRGQIKNYTPAYTSLHEVKFE